jgi:hypothetical protein
LASISLTRTLAGTTSDVNANLNNNWTALENLLNGSIDATNLAAASVGASELTQMGAATDQALIWNGSAWAPLSVVRPTLVDAKGDLLVGSAADTLVRKAAGTNEYVLVADSGQSDGLRWQKRPRLQTNTTAAGTGAATIETDLQTITIAANALAVGDVVRIRAAEASRRRCPEIRCPGEAFHIVTAILGRMEGIGTSLIFRSRMRRRNAASGHRPARKGTSRRPPTCFIRLAVASQRRASRRPLSVLGGA